MKTKLIQTFAPSVSKLLTLFSLLLLFSASAFSQTVSGTVSSAANQPLQGVTVLVKNTKKATLTNDAGRFQLNASANDVLVFSSVGYTPREVAVNGQTSIQVSLDALTQGLDEVIVTAL